MRIMPRANGTTKKEPVTPPVQKAAAPAPTVRKSEKPQPKVRPSKKVEAKPVIKTESKVEEEIVEASKKISLFEEILVEQTMIEE